MQKIMYSTLAVNIWRVMYVLVNVLIIILVNLLNPKYEIMVHRKHDRILIKKYYKCNGSLDQESKRQ